MIKPIWKKIDHPFFVLAPMAGITDLVFRRVIQKCGRPEIFFTEFVSAHGLCSEGKKELLKTLAFDQDEQPIIAQLFGSDPKMMADSAQLVESLGFSGVDLNMGCPDRAVIAQGAGSALIRNPALAQEIITTVQAAVKNIPVSVKTRIGFSSVKESDQWIDTLLETNLDALTIHARTVKELYQPVTHWEVVKTAVEKSKNKNTVIIGNGGIRSRFEGEKKMEETGCQGIMIGQKVLTNPWIFEPAEKEHGWQERLELLRTHAELYRAQYPDPRSLSPFKKFIAGYLSGETGARKIRSRLILSKTWEEFEDQLDETANHSQ